MKHVIEATVDVDNMRGVCKGTGRVKLRIGEGESLDQVRVNYLNKGFDVKDHLDNNNKQPKFSQDSKWKPKGSINPKMQKHDF